MLDENQVAKEKMLLAKLYECQDLMEHLLNEGTADKHYFLIEILIKRLELHLQHNHDLM
jgi:hypothetical protein